MCSATRDLELYREFLESIPLDEFREEFRKIKWVEQDLPAEMLPLASIYEHYWDAHNFLDFDSWFECFWEELHSTPESLRVVKQFKKYYFDKDGDGWFKEGFKARMYRTWIALLTQLDFCYVLASVAEKQDKELELVCNAELDRKGIDLRIGDIGFQVAKVSQRKEARAAAKTKKKGGIEVISIPYPVYNIQEIERKTTSSRVKPENREAYKRTLVSFFRYCAILDNEFVVFGEDYVTPIVENIGDPNELKKRLTQISLELSGEL